MPTRTPPGRARNGISEIASAAAAPTIASVDGSCVGIGREDHGDDLRLVQEAFGEQRPDRPVDQAAGENFFFGGTSFAFDEAAGKSSRGVRVFTIIDGEREKARAAALGSSAVQAVTRTTESPDRTTTAPFACLAIFLFRE